MKVLKDNTSNIHIALHEPVIPQNTGNIARTCAVTGCALHLVGKLGFEISDAKLKRAGLDYWHSLEIYRNETLDELFSMLEGWNFFYFTTKAARCYCDVEYPQRSCLIFGKETSGLPTQLLDSHPERCVRIPMKSEQRSLNLSNSVAIATYEVLRRRGFEGLEQQGLMKSFDYQSDICGPGTEVSST